MNEWQVPMPPEQRAANALRRRRYGWGAAGGAVGLLAVAATLLLLVGAAVDQQSPNDIAYAGLGVLFLSGLLTVVLLVTGALLAIARALRPFAVGLLIGTAVGMICTNGVCFAVVASLG